MNKHLCRQVSSFLYLASLASAVLIVGCSGSSNGVSVTPPRVVSSVNPEDSASNVAVKTSVSVTFNTPMNTASVERAFSIRPNVSGTFSWENQDTVMTFTPSSDLAVAAQQYTCTLGTGAQDIDGTALSSPYEWRWTTWPDTVRNLVGDANYDNGYSVTTDSSGNTYFTGMFYGDADFAAYFGESNPKTSSGSADIFVTKINADGTYAWTKRIGGTGSDSADFIDTDESGNVYLEGTFDSTIDFGADFDTSDIKTASESSETFVTKINADGTYGWTEKNYSLDNVSGLLGGGSTVRHIYNKSSKSIKMFAFNLLFGNVYFLDCPKGTVKNGPCTIPPGTTLAWEFTRTAGQSWGWVTSEYVGDCTSGCWVKNTYKQYWGRGGFDKEYQDLPGVKIKYNGPALDVNFYNR